MQKSYMSWEELDRQISFISQGITQDKIKVDCIISVGRGGMIPARLLSDKLNVHEVYTYPVKLYKNNETVKSEDGIKIEPFKHDIENKNCILIDDICDTGETLECVIEQLNHCKPKDIKIVVVANKEKSKLKPDYYHTRINESLVDSIWVVFPWEMCEYK